MWQFLVKNWVRGYATDQLRKAATEKVHQHVASKTEQENEATYEPASADIGPVDVGIVMSHSSEAGSFIDRLSDTATFRADGFTVHVGIVKSKRVVIAVSGDEPQSAANATQAIVDGHQPTWIIAAGFATAHARHVAAGDVVLADQVLDGAGHRLQLDLNVDRQSLESVRGTHVGAVLSRPLAAAESSQDTTTQSDSSPLCADVQSFAVAETCRKNRLPCLVVRTITQAANEQTPADIQHLHNQSSVAGMLGAATGAVWRRPSSVKDMWHDKEVALRGSERLADFLCGMLAQLPSKKRDGSAKN